MSDGLIALTGVVENLSYKVMELVVIAEIVMEKLEITDEQIKERFKNHIKVGQGDLNASSVQPTEAGSDEDHSGGGKQ